MLQKRFYKILFDTKTNLFTMMVNRKMDLVKTQVDNRYVSGMMTSDFNKTLMDETYWQAHDNSVRKA